ncbi:hypothetical protein DE146DRAFT_438459 [Phaeosphaeria sp. MPI-PUGE-AT-0046c]|nr:hypothetical protein DE146DRAFT_438459 [Phaeosphaeria sp. MPI-PUGE-AT-0046c]
MATQSTTSCSNASTICTSFRSSYEEVRTDNRTRDIVDRISVSLFRSQRKLEAERTARQRIENELRIRRWQAFQDDLRREARELQRKESLLKKDEIARIFRTHLDELEEEREEDRRREKLDRQNEAEQRQLQEQKEHSEQERLEKESRLQQERDVETRQSAPEAMRDRRELARSPYELDNKIWNLRHVRRPDYPVAQNYMELTDAIMEDILRMLELWGDTNNHTWSAEEWEKVKVIRDKTT